MRALVFGDTITIYKLVDKFKSNAEGEGIWQQAGFNTAQGVPRLLLLLLSASK